MNTNRTQNVTRNNNPDLMEQQSLNVKPPWSEIRERSFKLDSDPKTQICFGSPKN